MCRMTCQHSNLPVPRRCPRDSMIERFSAGMLARAIVKGTPPRIIIHRSVYVYSSRHDSVGKDAFGNGRVRRERLSRAPPSAQSRTNTTDNRACQQLLRSHSLPHDFSRWNAISLGNS